MIGDACRACGHIFTIDMNHKLNTYIVKVGITFLIIFVKIFLIILLINVLILFAKNPPDKDIDAQGSLHVKKKDMRAPVPSAHCSLLLQLLAPPS